MILLFALWVTLGFGGTSSVGLMPATIMFGYFGYSLILLLVAWKDWWLDFHLALPALVIDSAAFWAALFFTESNNFDTFSPFSTFFVLLIVSAGVRWNQKVLPALATVLGVAFVLAGILLRARGVPIDPQTLARRFSYLATLALILIWYSHNRSPQLSSRFARLSGGDVAPPFSNMLAYAMQLSGAAGAALIWANEDETKFNLQLAGNLGDRLAELSPDSIEFPECDCPMLFDIGNGHVLALTGQGKLVARNGANDVMLAVHLGITKGLSAPVLGSRGKGQMVLTGIDGMSWDDIFLSQTIARELSQALDEEETESLNRELALTRVRANLARDLHDSVAQSLAGTQFRLDSLRENPGAGRDVRDEVDGIIASLRAEEDNLCAIIDRLRRGDAFPGTRDLRIELVALAASLTDQWRVDVQVVDTGEPIRISTSLIFELQQIVREAVANAARHGGARHVAIDLRWGSPNTLSISVKDDGTGFRQDASNSEPRSISERVSTLGGSLKVRSTVGDTRIELQIPAKART